MIKFERNVCPLCNKVMRLRQVAKVNVFDCPNYVECHLDSGKTMRSHYEVECDKGSVIQHINLGQWSIDNFDNSYKSRLYKMDNNKWKLIGEFPQVKADTVENMLTRINKLTQL